MGTVRDFVFSGQGGIASVVISVQNELIVVPFNVVELDFLRRLVLLDLNRERLLSLPGFNPVNDVRTFSALLRAAIQLREGNRLGRLADIIINEQARIDFAILALEQRLIAVPFSLARLDLARQLVIFDLDRDLLLRAPSFTAGNFPNLSANSPFVQQVQTFFHVSASRQEPRLEPRPGTARPGTNPPEKPLPENRPPEKRPPETRPPAQQPPESRPPQRPPETRPPAPRPPEPRPPAPRPPEGGPEKRPPMPPPEHRPPERRPPGLTV